MIHASFCLKDGVLSSVEVSGHAGYANKGGDIVCAAVTSAVQMAANGVTEILKSPAEVEARDNLITIRLSTGDKSAIAFLEALRLQLELLSAKYKDTITVTI